MAVPVLVVLAVTMPDDDPTVATELVLVVHVPPVVRSLRLVVLLLHTAAVPRIGVIAPMVTVVVLVQPETSV